jgi:hypothetical protein
MTFPASAAATGCAASASSATRMTISSDSMGLTLAPRAKAGCCMEAALQRVQLDSAVEAFVKAAGAPSALLRLPPWLAFAAGVAAARFPIEEVVELLARAADADESVELCAAVTALTLGGDIGPLRAMVADIRSRRRAADEALARRLTEVDVDDAELARHLHEAFVEAGVGVTGVREPAVHGSSASSSGAPPRLGAPRRRGAPRVVALDDVALPMPDGAPCTVACFKWTSTAGAAREESECAICISAYAAEERVVRLPCMHCFHEACMVQCCRSGRPECPTCRTSVRGV